MRASPMKPEKSSYSVTLIRASRNFQEFDMGNMHSEIDKFFYDLTGKYITNDEREEIRQDYIDAVYDRVDYVVSEDEFEVWKAQLGIK